MGARAKSKPYTIPAEILEQFDWMTPPERRLAIAKHVIEEQCRRDVKRSPSKRAKEAVRRRREAELVKLAFPPLAVKETFAAGHELCCTQCSIWQELVHANSEPFLRGLRRAVSSRKAEIAAEALEHLAWFASESDTPRVRKAAASRNPRTVQAALWGMELAAIHNRSSQRHRAIAADIARNVVSGERRFPGSDAANELYYRAVECLRSVSPKDAREFLASGRCVRPGNPAVEYVLQSLYHDRDAGRRFVAPASDDLWAVDDALAKRRSRPNDYGDVRALLLTLAAEVDPTNTRSRAQALLATYKDKDQPGAELAREALRRCKGYANPDELLARLRRKPARFSRKAAGVLRSYELALSYVGDGLTITLANGCDWQLAAQGMLTMGLSAAAKATRAAAAVFGPGGVPTRMPASMKAHDALSDRQLARLEKLESSFEPHAVRVLDTTRTYISTNFAEFK